jgi:hypothetical protein
MEFSGWIAVKPDGYAERRSTAAIALQVASIDTGRTRRNRAIAWSTNLSRPSDSKYECPAEKDFPESSRLRQAGICHAGNALLYFHSLR